MYFVKKVEMWRLPLLIQEKIAHLLYTLQMPCLGDLVKQIDPLYWV